MMNPMERRRSLMLAVATIFVSLLETVSLFGVMPLVSLIIEPTVIETNHQIAAIHGILGGPAYTLFVKIIAAGVITLLALNVGANLTLMILVKRFRVACQDRLAQHLVIRCVNAPYAWIVRQNSTTLAHYVLNDVLIWSSSGIHGIMAIISHLSFLLLVAGVVLWATHLTGLIGLLLIGSVVVTIMTLLRPKIRELSDFRRTAMARSFSFASEFLSGIKDVKLSGRAPAFVKVYGVTVNTYGNAIGKLKVLQSIPPLVMLFLGQSAVIGIALFLWGMGKSSGQIAAEMALVLLITARAIPATIRLSAEFGTLWNAIPNLTGIKTILTELDQAKATEAPASHPAGAPTSFDTWTTITLNQIGYDYGNGRAAALTDISATLENGKSYGIVGPTGSGKTTLVDLILGLLHPTTGCLSIDGVALQRDRVGDWQNRIGYVPQSPLIADASLLENVAFGVPAKEADRDHAAQCLRMADLSDVLEDVTLDGPLGERGNRLSGGQRQRVAIARALYDRPDILVLDEATSALDTISEKNIKRALNNLHGNITTIMIAHSFSTIEHCDEIFVLEKGHLVERGTYSQLLQSSPLFRNLASAVSGDDD